MSTDAWNADKITLDNWEPMMCVMKRPITVHATQLNFPEGFIVTTRQGVVEGKPGDYLMIGQDGEKYPCDKDIFEKTYDVVSPFHSGDDHSSPIQYMGTVDGVTLYNKRLTDGEVQEVSEIDYT